MHADDLRASGIDLKLDEELTELPSCHISRAGHELQHIRHHISSIYCHDLRLCLCCALETYPRLSFSDAA